MRCNRLKRAIREQLAFAPKSGTRCWRSPDVRSIQKTRKSLAGLDRSFPDLPDECDCVADFILPEVQGVAFGLNSAICPMPLERRFGKSRMIHPAILMLMCRFNFPALAAHRCD